jgi:hypothetical protein
MHATGQQQQVCPRLLLDANRHRRPDASHRLASLPCMNV